MTDTHAVYDCICVGSGVGGLSAALNLQKEYPTWKIAVVEKYKGLGGRTYSYSPPGFEGVSWEMGAGRVSGSHVKLKALLKKYGLNLVPISNQLAFKADGSAPIVPNPFESFSVPAFLSPLTLLDLELQKKHTLYELTVSVYGKERADSIFVEFPYFGEVKTLRADLALATFLQGEMSSHDNYFVVAEAFSELIRKMADEFQSKGGVVLTRHSVLDVQKADGTATDIVVEFGRKEDEFHGTITLRASKCVVLGLHCDALRKIPGLRGMRQLDLVETNPLFRIYAIFPKPAWFRGLGRVVTEGGIRYMIPINEAKGVTMISYTDGKDTETYHKAEQRGERALQKAVMKDVRALFPDKKIPDPVFIRGHYWETGCTYWLPGDYDVKAESLAACYPLPTTLPRVFVCGESFSLRQAWVEGALEHTEQCMTVLKKVMR